MPEAQRPLSAHLGQVFSAAEARADGVPARRLKSSDLIRVCRGLYLRRSAPELRAELEASHPAARAYQSHLERALAVGKYLPAGHFLSHASAAVVWGLPVPTNRLSRIEVACFRPLRRLRRTDVWAHEASAQTTIVTEVQGVPVSGPASTWAMLAPTLSMRDGVALGDAVIRQHRIPGTSRVPARPLATITELDAAVAAGRRIGVARLRELLPQYRIKAHPRPRVTCGCWCSSGGCLRPSLISMCAAMTVSCSAAASWCTPNAGSRSSTRVASTGPRRLSGTVTSRSIGTMRSWDGR